MFVCSTSKCLLNLNKDMGINSCLLLWWQQLSNQLIWFGVIYWGLGLQLKKKCN